MTLEDKAKARLEPAADLSLHVELCAQVSTAISLKRIADVLDGLDKPSEQGNNLSQKVYYSIYNALAEGLAQWNRSR